MKIIILIILLSWLMYKKGVFGKFLNQITEPNEPETITSPPEPTAPTERQRLEMQARIVVSQMGENPDTVVYMGDGLLQALINDYTRENK